MSIQVPLTRLVIATHNRGKLREFQAGLADLMPAIELVSLADWPGAAAVDETGTTYRENARLKALAARELTGFPSVGDDTGLEVDALDGAPGLHSARWTGLDANPARNRARLLTELAARPEAPRTARFRCVLALALTGAGEPEYFEGIVEGSIAREERGGEGFGYDPIFLVESTNRTMAEMSLAEKEAVSHRGRALAKLKARLAALR